MSFYLLMQTKIPGRFERMKRYIYDRLANGSLKPRVDRLFRFEEVVDAYKYLESNQQIGKIVITLDAFPLDPLCRTACSKRAR